MAFFAFDPRPLRRRLYFAVVGGLAVAVWAVVGVVRGTERFASLRAVASVLLVAALCALAWRLRPRPGYGVRVEPTALVFARPLSGEVAFPSTSLVSVVCRRGGRSPVIEITLREGQRILLPRELFASDEAFAEVSAALEEASPPPSHQA